jgi:hypothetical protein
MKTGQIYRVESDGELYLVVRRANVDYALVSLYDGQSIWANGRTLDQLYNTTRSEVTLFTGTLTIKDGKIS